MGFREALLKTRRPPTAVYTVSLAPDTVLDLIRQQLHPHPPWRWGNMPGWLFPLRGEPNHAGRVTGNRFWLYRCEYRPDRALAGQRDNLLLPIPLLVGRVLSSNPLLAGEGRPAGAGRGHISEHEDLSPQPPPLQGKGASRILVWLVPFPGLLPLLLAPFAIGYAVVTVLIPIGLWAWQMQSTGRCAGNLLRLVRDSLPLANGLLATTIILMLLGMGIAWLRRLEVRYILDVWLKNALIR